MTQALIRELRFRSLKMIDIVYVSIIQFGFAYFLGQCIDDFFEWVFGNSDDKSRTKIMIEVFVQVTIIALVLYITKNIIELIPSPFDGLYGFQHNRVKEVKSGTFLAIFIAIFQVNMQSKIAKLRK